MKKLCLIFLLFAAVVRADDPPPEWDMTLIPHGEDPRTWFGGSYWVQTTNLMQITSNGCYIVMTNQVTGATNSLWVSFTNYPGFVTTNTYVPGTNTLWQNTTNLVTTSTNGLWITTTNLVTGATNTLWVSTTNQVTQATNTLWVATTNAIQVTSNGCYVVMTNTVTGATNVMYIAITNLLSGYVTNNQPSVVFGTATLVRVTGGETAPAWSYSDGDRYLKGSFIAPCSSDGKYVYLTSVTTATNVLYSSNYGTNFFDPVSGTNMQVRSCLACSSNGQIVIVGSGTSFTRQLYISVDYGTNYVPAGDSPAALTYYGGVMADDASVMYVQLNRTTTNVLRSVNCGTNWTECPTVRTNSCSINPMACSADGTKVLATHSTGGGLEYSQDSGLTWRLLITSTDPLRSPALSDDGRVMYVVSNITTFCSSFDGGTTWRSQTIAGGLEGRATQCSSDGQIVALSLTGTGNNSLQISSDYGQTWALITNVFTYGSYGVGMTPAGSIIYAPDYYTASSGGVCHKINYTSPVFTNVLHTGHQLPAQDHIFDSGNSSNRWRDVSTYQFNEVPVSTLTTNQKFMSSATVTNTMVITNGMIYAIQ